MINNNKINKSKNAKILINKFFNLLGLKKNKILYIQNHGWKYSSNSKPLKIKSYWNSSINLVFVLIGLLDLDLSRDG